MNILVIQLRRIGDILLTTPVIPYLKQQFPSANIDFLCEPCGRDVLITHPDIRQLRIYDKTKSLAEVAWVRQQKYDLIIDFMANPRSGWLALFSGARYRVGYRKNIRRFFYSQTMREPAQPEYVPVRKLRLAQAAVAAVKGISVETVPPARETTPQLFLTEEETAFAQRWLREAGLDATPFCAMAPAHRHPIRQWRWEGFREVAQSCFSQWGLKTVLAWGPGEKELALQIQKGCESFVQLMPPTTLRQMAAIVKNASCMVTNDSGNMHVAVALGTPTVTIYGPTRPVDWNPGGVHSYVQAADLSCLGCHLSTCPIGHVCMERVSSDDVRSKIDLKQFKTEVK